MGDDFTIADVAMIGWVRNLVGFYGAREIVEFDTLTEVPRWLERGAGASGGAARAGDSGAAGVSSIPPSSLRSSDEAMRVCGWDERSETHPFSAARRFRCAHPG